MRPKSLQHGPCSLQLVSAASPDLDGLAIELPLPASFYLLNVAVLYDDLAQKTISANVASSLVPNQRQALLASLAALAAG